MFGNLVSRPLRAVATGAAAILLVGGLAGTATAAEGTFLNNSGNEGESVRASDTAAVGTTIRVSGNAWVTDTAAGAGANCIGVKITKGTGVGAGQTSYGITRNTAVTGAPGTACEGKTTSADMWALIATDDSGNFVTDIDLPTAANAGGTFVASDWVAGATSHVRLLSGSLAGGKGRSAFVDFTIKNGPVGFGTPVITGSAKYGKVVSANVAPVNGAALKFQWKRNGVAIAGATKASYAITTADAGKNLTVTVTGTKASFDTATKTSKAVKVQTSKAVTKLIAAEAKAKKAQAKVDTLNAKIKATKANKNLKAKAKATKVKALKKKLKPAKKSLTAAKKALAKAQKAAR